MAEFKPIETQEDLNKIISARVNEERERISRKYSDYDELKASNASLTEERAAAKKAAADMTEKYKDYDQNIADLNAKVHHYEIDSVKTRVALGEGLPYEMASRLRGETEEEIQKDAETLKGFYKPKTQPLADPEPDISSKDPQRAALKKMLEQIKED